MEINSKKLWDLGGYGKDNDYSRSINRIRKHGNDKKINPEITNMVLAEFFLEIKDNPGKYIREGNVCDCGCGIRNSGTNAVHYLFRKLDERSELIQEQIDKVMTDDFNNMLNRIANRNKKTLRSKLSKFIGYQGYGNKS